MLKIADFRAFWRNPWRNIFASVLCLFAFFDVVLADIVQPTTSHTVNYNCFVRDEDFSQQGLVNPGSSQTEFDDNSNTGHTDSNTDTRTMCQKNMNHNDLHSTGPKPVGGGTAPDSRTCNDNEACGISTGVNPGGCFADGYDFKRWECMHPAGAFINRTGEDTWTNTFNINLLMQQNSSFAAHENTQHDRTILCSAHWEGHSHKIFFNGGTYGTAGCTVEVGSVSNPALADPTIRYGGEYNLFQLMPTNCESNTPQQRLVGWDCRRNNPNNHTNESFFVNAASTSTKGYDLCWDFDYNLICDARFEPVRLGLVWKDWDNSSLASLNNATSCLLGTDDSISPINSPVARTGYEFKGWKILSGNN